jgi:threonine/homoserine/homoserine lactone efflux protein
MTTSLLLTFLGASIAITIAPGPDNLFILTQGIARGRQAAIITALGMCSGISIHTLAAALGISAIFATSALAFSIVKYAGAAYLLYLAYLTIRSSGAVRLGKADVRPALALFQRGFIMNVLNPKVALFFLAFLPQFVNSQSGSVPAQMLLLGGLFMAQAVVLFTTLGYFSGSIGGYLLTRPRLAKYLDGLTAGVFTALALRLAFAER